MSDDLLSRFREDLAAEGKAEKTVSAYPSDIRVLQGFLQHLGRNLEDATDRDVRALRRELLQKGYAQASVNRRLNGIRSFCHWAVREEIYQKDPTQGLVRHFACRERRRSEFEAGSGG